jgi:hypothetical protein
VAPLAADPAIQQAVVNQLTAQIFTYLDVQGLTNQAVDALAARGLRPQLADRLRGFAGPLASGIQSQAFADAWTQANRVAHQALVKALTGQGDGAVTVEGDTITLNLAPFIETVKQRLVEGGFGLAKRIPEVNASFVLFDVKNLTRARSAFDLLNTLGIWLPIIALVLLGVGVVVAKDHRRALVGAAVGVAVAMLLLGLSLAVFRTIYLDALPAQVLPHDAAAVLYDTIVAYLRLGLRTILVLALVIAAGAFLTGPVGTWVHANKQLLRIAAVTLAALALVFWANRPARPSWCWPGSCWSPSPSSSSSANHPSAPSSPPQPSPEPGFSASTPKHVHP